MKIGLFTDSYFPLRDGVATSVSTLAKELKHHGHKVYVIAPKTSGLKDAKYIIRIIAFRLFKRPELWAGLEIPQPSFFRILPLKFDIIHGHSGGPITQFGLHMAKLKGVPFVATYHTLWKHYKHYFILPGIIKRGLLESLSAVFLNHCDAVVVPSQKVKTELLAYGVKKPIHIVPSGVNIKEFSVNDSNLLRSKLKIPKNRKILLTVGRLGKEKSMGFMIQAFAEAYKTYPRMVFVIVGEGRDNDKHKLIKLTRNLHVSQHVIFAEGFDFKDMPSVYKGSDLFLFASHTETQGMVVIESLASGIPVLAVHDSAFTGVIEDGYNGFMVQKNITEFSKKLLELIRNSDMRTKLGDNAKISAEKYSVEITTRALEEIYADLIRSRSF